MRPAGTFYLARGSPLKKIKSKKRNSLTDEHLENLLRVADWSYIYSVSASDQKSRCNTPESNFSLMSILDMMLKQQGH